MITFRAQKNAAAAREYFGEHLGRGDYRNEDGTIVGRWLGMGAGRLGLMDGAAVSQEQFEALCSNCHPTTGAKLTPRTNRAGERRVFTDFVVSAPKSVSIMALTMGDSRILEVHHRAARAAMIEVERFAGTRVRGGGAKDRDEDRATGIAVMAEFQHDASRAHDPQLHSHFLAFNCTYDLEEDRWKALQAGAMTRAVRYGTEVYRNELARGLLALGYDIEDAGKEGFQIAGVSEEMCQRFSERSAERDRAIERFRQGHDGREPTKDEVSVVVHRSRAAKLRDVPAAEVLAQQRAKLNPGELAALKAVRAAANGSHAISAIGGLSPGRDLTTAALAHATDHFFGHHSVVAEWNLLAEALVYGRGHIDLKSLRAGLEDTSTYLRMAGEVTTLETLRAERRLIEFVDEGVARYPALRAAFQPDLGLDAEQAQAVRAVLASTNAVLGLREAAGTGKTMVLREIVRGIGEGGGRAHLCAPTHRAKEVLQADGFTDATTLAALLVNPRLQATLTPQTVLVLDEAGLASVPQMDRLFILARERDCRVLLAGDSRQHASVEAGDALRMLERDSRLRLAELTRVRRQRAAEYRQAVTELAAGHAREGFERLDRAGMIEEVIDEGARYARAADLYLAALDAPQRRSTLVIAPTWREIARVNAEVRSRLLARGDLGTEERTFSTFHPLNWTRAQRRDVRRYQPGQVLLFHRAAAGFESGETLEVVSPAPDHDGRLRTRRADGVLVELDGKQAGAFEVYERRELPVAVGERLLLRGNRRKLGNTLTNGQTVTVAGFGPDGTIQLKDGHTLPTDYRTWCHGYAVTSHAAQGQTVIDAIVCAGARSLAAVSAESFYVAVSRARQTLTVLTDDREALCEAATCSAARKSALDLATFAEACRLNVRVATPTAKTRPALALAPPAIAASPAGPELEGATQPARSRRGLRPSPRRWWRRASRAGRWLGAQVVAVVRAWRQTAVVGRVPRGKFAPAHLASALDPSTSLPLTPASALDQGRRTSPSFAVASQTPSAEAPTPHHGAGGIATM